MPELEAKAANAVKSKSLAKLQYSHSNTGGQ
jgi:hypothetical protein